MSRPAVIGSLILAILLAVAGAVLLRPSPQAPLTHPLLAFRPSEVEEIRIAGPGAETPQSRLIRTGEGWAHLEGGEPEEAAWPVSAGSVEGALRLLTAMIGEPIDPSEAPHPKTQPKSQPEAPPDAQPNARIAAQPGEQSGQGVRVIEIDVTGGGEVRTWRLLVSPDSLGGRRAITVTDPNRDTRHARVEGEILGALLDTGPLAWREMFALPGVSLDTSRIGMRTGAGLVTLLRSSGRWLMADPVSAPAHEPAVTDLLQRLAAIRLERFIDEPDPDGQYGFGEPEAEVRLEREIRTAAAPHGNPLGAEIQRTIETRELVIGAPADLAGELRFARVTRTFREAAPGAEPATSQRTLVIRHASLERIAPQASVYVDPRTLQVPPEDVGGIEVTRGTEGGGGGEAGEAGESGGREVVASLDKTFDGWHRTVPDSPLILEEEKSLEAFIREMAAAADFVVIDPPAGALLNPVGVELKTLGGAPLARITVGALVEGEGESAVAHVGVRAGDVIRVYRRKVPWIEQFIADP